MGVAKVNELIGSSPDGFEEAARSVVARANRTLRGVTGFRVVEKRINELIEYIRSIQETS